MNSLKYWTQCLRYLGLFMTVRLLMAQLIVNRWLKKEGLRVRLDGVAHERREDGP